MTIKLALTPDQINVVTTALAELPFKQAAPVIASIQMQLRAAQQQATEAAKAAAEVPAEPANDSKPE